MKEERIYRSKNPAAYECLKNSVDFISTTKSKLIDKPNWKENHRLNIKGLELWRDVLQGEARKRMELTIAHMKGEVKIAPMNLRLPR